MGYCNIKMIVLKAGDYIPIVSSGLFLCLFILVREVKKVRNRVEKTVKSILVSLMAIALMTFSGLQVFAAEGDPFVISGRTADDGIYVYIKNVSGIEKGSTVQIGNTSCSNIMAAPISGLPDIPIKTVILLDNSLSFKSIWGDNGLELIKKIVDDHAEGELFSLFTFSDSLNEISKYTNDYEVFKTDVDSVEYANQDSFLTDALYALLSELQTDKSANYTRVLVVADGADENEITYTQAELVDLMKKVGVPIYTVGAKSGSNNKALEILFSYSRQTGGDYFTVEKSTGTEEIVEAFKADYSINCLKIIPENSLLDGSVKEAKLVIVSGGAQSTLVTSLQMPFGDGSAAQTVVQSTESENTKSETTESESTEVAEATEEKSEATTTDDGRPIISLDSGSSEEAESSGIPIFVFIIVGALVVIVVVVVLLILLNKKKQDNKYNAVVSVGGSAAEDSKKAEAPKKEQVYNLGEDKTLVLGAGSGEKTLTLFGGESGAEKQPMLVLKDTENADRVFKAPIVNTVTVGRTAGADIVLDFDQSVSGKHCAFTKKGGLYYLKDLGSSNGTKYGGLRVTNEIPIMTGGIVEIGRGKYKLEIEE